MEKRGVSVSPILIVCLVMGILAGQSQAQIGEGICYGLCFVGCVAGANDVGTCALQCLARCILPKSTTAGVKDTQAFCKLGCATALCSNISTKDDPAEKQVGSCLKGCSATCAKKN